MRNDRVVKSLLYNQLMGRSGRSTILRLLFSFRLQMIVGFAVVVFLPPLLKGGIAWHFSGSRDNSMLLAAFVLLFGGYVYRRLTSYTAVLGSTYIIPVFSLVYAFALIILLFFRIDYSRFILGMSYALTIIWFYGLHYISVKMKRNAFGIIPNGKTPALLKISGANWTTLAKPEIDPMELHNDCDAVIADFSSSIEGPWQRFLAKCALCGIPVFDCRQVREALTGRVQINHISENTLGTLTPNVLYMKLKVVADGLFAVLALVFLAPIMLIAALLIKLDSPGPVIFCQPRIGYRGKPFLCYKFRTMRVENEPLSPSNEESKEAAKTKVNDPRITRLGQFLRKSRIDELPQIFNILKTELSWIGPRPEAIVLAEWYERELPFYSYRHVVKPGISGWAQVRQGHVVEIDDVHKKLQYDFYYIKNFSFWLDISIVMLTIKTIFTGSGAK